MPSNEIRINGKTYYEVPDSKMHDLMQHIKDVATSVLGDPSVGQYFSYAQISPCKPKFEEAPKTATDPIPYTGKIRVSDRMTLYFNDGKLVKYKHIPQPWCTRK